MGTVAGFKEAGNWIGFVMEEEDFTKFVLCDNRHESVQSILSADKYDRHRRKSIKFKVERNMRIQTTQLNIIEYYITQRKGLIAWVKTDPRLVTEIHWRAAKAMLKDFKTCTYILNIARERKNCIDKLLLDYKTENKDFRYIIWNGEKDLRVLIKQASEGNILPYRNISLEVLGALTPLKTLNKDADDR